MDEQTAVNEKIETQEMPTPTMKLHPATEEFRKRLVDEPPKAEKPKVETANEALLLALEMMEAQLQIAAQSLESQARLCRLVIDKVKLGV
jgi:hypothetical protein